MSYEVRIANQAEAYFLRLDPRTRQRVLDRLRQIAQDPYGSHSKVLVNAGGVAPRELVTTVSSLRLMHSAES